MDQQRLRLSPTTISALYGLVAGTWIVLSDLVADGHLSADQTGKGLGFVAVTGAGLYFLTRSMARAVARSAALVAYQATHDPALGVANRAWFLEQLAGADGDAVVCVGVGPLERLLATYGQPACDDAVREVAARVEIEARSPGTRDAIARVRDDVLAFVVPECSAAELGALARRLLEHLAVPVRSAGIMLHVPVNVGVALGADGGTTPAARLGAAEAALHDARQCGAGEYRFFSDAMHVVARRHLAIEHSLRDLLASGAPIGLHYQPQYDARSGALRGAEALLRYTHPQLGAIAPDEVLAAAETAGLTVALGRRVLHDACAQAVTWASSGRPVRVAVNVAAQQLAHAAFARDVRQALTTTGLAAELLELEVTETSLVACEKAAPVLEALRALGVTVAIDDFGTGWSSLTYLARLPVDAVKVDRSFVAGLGRRPVDATLVRAIIALSHELGLDVIAEGVETTDQLAWLTADGCDAYQGYLASPPAPAAQLARIPTHAGAPTR